MSSRAGIGTTVRADSVPQKAVLSMNSVAELLQFTKHTPFAGRQPCRGTAGL